MTEHKHAWFLRALADGEPLEAFEAKSRQCVRFITPDLEDVTYIFGNPEDWEIRRTIKTININGIEVPEPCRVPPRHMQTYYLAFPTDEIGWYETPWRGFECEQRWFKRGLIHLTKEAAEAHLKALLSFTEVK